MAVKKGAVSREKLEQVVTEYSPHVKRLAGLVMGMFPEGTVFEKKDLEQSGYIGLIDACNRHDPERGASFWTYAAIRVRGTIIEDARKADDFSRGYGAERKSISNAKRRTEQTLLREPFHAEVAEFLNMDIREYYRILDEGVPLRGRPVVGHMFDYRKDLLGLLLDDEIEEECCGLNKVEQQRDLLKAMKKLSVIEQELVKRHYGGEMDLIEIGALILGTRHGCIVTKVHNSAKQKLREVFGVE